MTVTKKGWDQNLMASVFAKEATYDAGITFSTLNAASFLAYEFEPAVEDVIMTDKDEVTGKEHGYTQEISQHKCAASIKFPKVTPNALAGFAALVLGSCTSTKDGAYAGYRHKIIPVADGTALPSIAVAHKVGAIQTQYKGLKGNTLKLSGEEGQMLSMECGMMGSGTRATDSQAFVAAISESWIKNSHGIAWLETGADIGIQETLTLDVAPVPADWSEAATLTGATSGTTCVVVSKTSSTIYIVKSLTGNFTSGEVISDGTNSRDCGVGYPIMTRTAAAEDISLATPDDIRARVKSFEFTWDNKLEEQFGFGNTDLVLLDAHYGRRSADLKVTVRFSSTTELTYFTSQEVCAFELDWKGAIIEASGSMYYGAKLIIPRAIMKVLPAPKGGVNDTLTQDFEFNIYNDGSNPPVILDVYNAQATYLA